MGNKTKRNKVMSTTTQFLCPHPLHLSIPAVHFTLKYANRILTDLQSKYHCLFINYYYYKKQSLSTLSYFMMDLNVLMKSILEILLKTCQRRGIFNDIIKDFRFRNPLIGKLDKWSSRMEGVNSIVLVLRCCFWVTRRKSFLWGGIISRAKMRKLIKV